MYSASGHAQQIGHLLPEIAVAKAIDEVLKQRQRQQQRHHPRLAELQSRRLFAVFGHGRLHHPLDAVAAQAAVVADAFDFQQAPIDLPADLLQVGQIGQAFVHAKVVRVAERSLRPAAAAFLEVLFQIEVLVVDVQARMHAILDHPRAELARASSWSPRGRRSTAPGPAAPDPDCRE